MAVIQEPVSFPVEGVEVRGMAYRPESGPCRLGMVLIDPFAEEKKCAQRTMAQMGRSLAAAGIYALHFDYRGTGDSGGRFEQFDLEDWQADLRAAVDYIRVHESAGRVGLLGLRLGTTLALEQAAACRAYCLVLWEPLLEGERYLRELFQRSSIKTMLSGGSPQGSEADSEQTPEFIDLDGYRMSPPLTSQLRALNALSAPQFNGPVLLVECKARGEVSAAGRGLLQAYPRGEAEALVLEPFWQRIGLVDTAQIVTTTLDWLASLGEVDAQQ